MMSQIGLNFFIGIAIMFRNVGYIIVFVTAMLMGFAALALYAAYFKK